MIGEVKGEKAEMRREIKFRAFYKGVMIPDVTVCSNPTHIWFSDELVLDVPEDFFDACQEGETGYWILDGFELMQFTGLKDKNGKDIYEGDILQEKGSDELIYGDISPVEFNKGEFHVTLQYDLTPASLSYCKTLWAENGYKGDEEKDTWLSSIEVMGNIYENPELLNNAS